MCILFETAGDITMSYNTVPLENPKTPVNSTDQPNAEACFRMDLASNPVTADPWNTLVPKTKPDLDTLVTLYRLIP